MPATATVTSLPLPPLYSYTHVDSLPPSPSPRQPFLSLKPAETRPRALVPPRSPPHTQSLAPPSPYYTRRPSARRQSSHESYTVTDSTEVRSSSETTAATIFSMYGEDHAGDANAEADDATLSPVEKAFAEKELPAVPVEVTQPPESPSAPTSPVDPSTPPSIRLRTPSNVSGLTPSASLNLPQQDDGLSVPSPRITVSSQSTPGTLSRSSSHAYSVQAPDEDAESYHVRATYARLDREGVPGDGFEEGKERTRTRIVSAYSVRGVLDLAASGLSAREEAVLKGLDRYGFIMVSEAHHDARLALLPAAPFHKSASPTKLSSVSAQPSPPEISAVPTLPSLPRDKENQRIDKWDRMMTVAKRDQGGNVAAWTFDKRKGRKLRLRLYKGIPDRWRGAAWYSVIEQMSPSSSASNTSKPTPSQLALRYHDLIDRPSTYDIQIDLDVPRTISGHVLFHTRYGLGQRSLFHVLHSFSLLCPECGYVQGMGPIAATLLCYLEPERAYSCLVRLHDDYDMHTIFQPGFPGLLEALYIQERLMERLLPDVYTSFTTHMISSTSYATKWYITLFANTVPFQTQLRIWDAFFLEGRDLIIVVALAVLWTLRDYLASPEANFETILSLLSSYFVAEDEGSLMSWIRNTLDNKGLRGDMARWRSDWRTLVERGESGKALL